MRHVPPSGSSSVSIPVGYPVECGGYAAYSDRGMWSAARHNTGSAPSLQLPFVGNSMASPSFGGYRAPASQRSGSATPARASSQRPLAPEVSPQMFGSVRVPRKSASMTFPFHFEADSLPDAHLKGVGLAEISSRRLPRALRQRKRGVVQEAVGCTAQFQRCMTQCRREVQEIAAACKMRGEKYVDPDFHADDRSVFACGSASGSSFVWKRASEGALTSNSIMASPRSLRKAASAPLRDVREVFVPGFFQDAHILGALAAMKSFGQDPQDLLVGCEGAAGVLGVCLFQDGEWCFEIIDDFLPVQRLGKPACCHTVTDLEVKDWAALIEKACAKCYGTYEALTRRSELDALEDFMDVGANRVDLREFPIWGELWQHMRTLEERGAVMMLAVRRREAVGEKLTNGLISGFGYPLLRTDYVDNEMVCELVNPWPRGSYINRKSAPLDAEPTSKSFSMSIHEFCQHFTEILEVRLLPPDWQVATVACSAERPCYPLISVPHAAQGILVATDCGDQGSYEARTSTLGLRVFRCRVVAPPSHSVGARQDVSNPFRNLEILAERHISARSVVVELPQLEPSCLYLATVELDDPSSWAALRVFTSSSQRFRELSTPEAAYFVEAQSSASIVDLEESSRCPRTGSRMSAGTRRVGDANFQNNRSRLGDESVHGKDPPLFPRGHDPLLVPEPPKIPCEPRRRARGRGRGQSLDFGQMPHMFQALFGSCTTSLRC